MTFVTFNDVLYTTPPTPRFGRPRRHPELERLICAAVIDARFAAVLLSDPARALRESGIGAKLSADERTLVLSIDGACDIHDFAGRLYDAAYPSEGDHGAW